MEGVTLNVNVFNMTSKLHSVPKRAISGLSERQYLLELSKHFVTTPCGHLGFYKKDQIFYIVLVFKGICGFRTLSVHLKFW